MFENTNIKIIDVHQHLGSCRVFDVNVPKEELLETTNNNGIAASQCKNIYLETF